MPSTTSLLALALASTVHYTYADEPLLTSADAQAYNAGHYGLYPNQTYHTVNFTAPRFLVSKHDKNATSSASHIFISRNFPNQTLSPMIFDSSDLSLVYMDPAWSGGSDTVVQDYDGEPYLTFWSGNQGQGSGSGGGVMLDTSYSKVKNLTTTGFPTLADSHDFQFTDDGGAMLVNNYQSTADCSSVATGKNVTGTAANCTVLKWSFQEVDIATGEARFTWHAEDHFNMTESYALWDGNATKQWDWFHLNSIAKTSSGDYLVSGRLLAMFALINGTDGSVIYQVGGVNSDYEDISANGTAWFGFQHHVRFADLPNRAGGSGGSGDNAMDEVTLFDNHVLLDTTSDANGNVTPGCTTNCSRGLHIKLDHSAKTYDLVHAYPHPVSVQTFAEGSYQHLPNDNVLVGYGTVPALAEFTKEGESVLELQYGPWAMASQGLDGSYRVFKYNWKATPHTKPAVAVVDGTVYVSWNGATEVEAWVLFGGADESCLEKLAMVFKAGFETGIKVNGTLPAMVQVQALDGNGHKLEGGLSEIVTS